MLGITLMEDVNKKYLIMPTKIGSEWLNVFLVLVYQVVLYGGPLNGLLQGVE